MKDRFSGVVYPIRCSVRGGPDAWPDPIRRNHFWFPHCQPMPLQFPRRLHLCLRYVRGVLSGQHNVLGIRELGLEALAHGLLVEIEPTILGESRAGPRGAIGFGKPCFDFLWVLENM